ncbi:MAG: integrase core domain-containing protein [Polyangiaceae bacterium]
MEAGGRRKRTWKHFLASHWVRGATHLIHDRDPLFTDAWTNLLESNGVQCCPIPASSPNCNPYAERFVKTVRAECLNRFVTFGERHLRHLLTEFTAHYNTERPPRHWRTPHLSPAFARE